MARPQSVATGPTDGDVQDAEKAALQAEIDALKAQLALAPPAQPLPPKVVTHEPPKLGTDPFGTLAIPRRFHGVMARDPVIISGKNGAKSFVPGSSYKTGPNGTPITCDEARTILNAFSEDCWRLKMKDVNDGDLNVFLGEVHENG
jgi:hypothetical protein